MWLCRDRCVLCGLCHKQNRSGNLLRWCQHSLGLSDAYAFPLQQRAINSKQCYFFTSDLLPVGVIGSDGRYPNCRHPHCSSAWCSSAGLCTICVDHHHVSKSHTPVHHTTASFIVEYPTGSNCDLTIWVASEQVLLWRCYIWLAAILLRLAHDPASVYQDFAEVLGMERFQSFDMIRRLYSIPPNNNTVSTAACIHWF